MQRDWLGHFIQTVATVATILVALWTWGGARIDPRIADFRAEVASQRAVITDMNARLTQDETDAAHAGDQNGVQIGSIAAKLNDLASKMAAVGAQLGDLREEVGDLTRKLDDPPQSAKGGP